MTPQEQEQLVEAVKPAIKFLCENFHPHTTIIITQTGVEVVEGVVSIQGVNDYLVD